MDVVFCQAARDHLRVHLDSWHAAALAHGSTHELCVEIHVADGADKYYLRRRLAFHAARLRTLVCRSGDRFRVLHPARSRLDGREEAGKAHVSVCRIVNMVFAIIAALTIGAAVAAMSLRNLI